MAQVLTDHGPEALNYSPNPGITELREFLATRMARIERIRCSPEEILVCSGGLEGIRHCFNALTNPGDPVLFEDPTYMVALQVCRELAGIPVGVSSDDAGMIPEALDDTALRLAREGRPARILYVGPSFPEPDGPHLEPQAAPRGAGSRGTPRPGGGRGPRLRRTPLRGRVAAVAQVARARAGDLRPHLLEDLRPRPAPRLGGGGPGPHRAPRAAEARHRPVLERAYPAARARLRQGRRAGRPGGAGRRISTGENATP